MENNVQLIYDKLELFIKKFYTNELLRGSIFFVGIGLLYFLFTLIIESFFWLSPFFRAILFWLFLFVELFLLLRFIFFPLFKLFKLQKGIDYIAASSIIGTHFTDVDDKLLNFLQLSQDTTQSDLLLAAIHQRALSLKPFNFSNAIHFSKNKKFIPLALLPILLFIFFYISGHGVLLTQSFNRVVHFNTPFSPPAPYQFIIQNASLQTQQHENFTLKVKTTGSVIPDNISILIENEAYFLEKSNQNEFYFTFEHPSKSLSFQLSSNQVLSPLFHLEVFTVPTISNFNMFVQFPAYLNKKPQSISGTGNAIIPEGATITWTLQTLATQHITWFDGVYNSPFLHENNSFKLSKIITQNTDYQIFTSNNKLKNFEKLSYQIAVIQDQFPTINASQVPDSLQINKPYVVGQIADDYGLSKLQIVYYPIGQNQKATRGTMAIQNKLVDQFVFAFPSNLPVQAGITYEYYFEVFDNDAPHHFKSTKSDVFSNTIHTASELKVQQLQQQNNTINSISKSLLSQNKQLSELDKIQKLNKEKDILDFKDKQKIDNFIKNQLKQDEMMHDFTEKLKSNLQQNQDAKQDKIKDELLKRLDNSQKDVDKNKQLLEELKQLNNKLEQEDLLQKLDQFKQNAKNQTKTLEQLVALTKKFYVEKKAEQIADQLNDLSNKQDKLAQDDKQNAADKQEAINKDFDKIKNDLDQLDKENQQLKSPLDLPNQEEEQQSVSDDLQKAKEALQKNSKEKAKPKQKDAAKKMKEMSQKMSQQMDAGEQEQLEEDIKILRQILDNLQTFSFAQEEVMKDFRGLKSNAIAFNKNLKLQQNLKIQFKHIDDSLFAFSLRNARLTEKVTKEVGNIAYSLDKSITHLVEAQVYQAVSDQHYTISSANILANMLASMLNNMQMDMNGAGKGSSKSGKGSSSGMQLPDIIKKQEQIGDKIKKQQSKGKQPGGETGSKPGNGAQGQSGSEGQKGEGSSGKNGNNNDSKGSSQNGSNGESDAEAIMQIYKEQQLLRDALQQQLDKNGVGGSGQNAINQMKDIEKQILNKGFKNNILESIKNIKQELLKLDKAIQEQGEEEQRQSQTNTKPFVPNQTPLPIQVQQYIKSIELLTRQNIPFQTEFHQRVQYYFKP